MTITKCLFSFACFFILSHSLRAQNVNIPNGYELYFEDNGQIRSLDNNHRFIFRRSENIMELREFGSILFSPGATTGAETGKVIMTSNGNVGIGTTTPSAPLHVSANTDNGNIGGSLKLSHSGKTTAGTARDWVIYNMSGVYGNSLQFWAYDLSGGLIHSRLTIMDNGNVGIGTIAPQAKLAVNGDIFSKKVKVTQTGWPDYVFNPMYHLRPLSEVEQHIKQHGHLPEVPTAEEVAKDGLDVGDNQATLLKKIEELTLYLIEQNKNQQIQNQKLLELDKRVNALQQENDRLKEQLKTFK